MVRKEFQLHEVIFKEEDCQLWMYSICEGSVNIYSEYGTASSKKLATLTAGQFFGEIGMIGMLPRTATAIAAEDHVVLDLIQYEDLEAYLEDRPEDLQLFMRNVSGRIRALTEDFAQITQTTNEALQERAALKAVGSYLSEAFRKLLDRLQADKSSDAEYAVGMRRRQALLEDVPTLVPYRAGEAIFLAGDQADCMYEIRTGSIGIYSDYNTDNEKLLAKLDEQAVFGEMGILDEMPRSASAVCLEDSWILVIGKGHFLHFFRKEPEKVMQIMKQMCYRLRDLSDTYVEVCKTIKELAGSVNKAYEEDVAWMKLEYFRESQLYSKMYEISCSADWLHDYYNK